MPRTDERNTPLQAIRCLLRDHDGNVHSPFPHPGLVANMPESQPRIRHRQHVAAPRFMIWIGDWL